MLNTILRKVIQRQNLMLTFFTFLCIVAFMKLYEVPHHLQLSLWLELILVKTSRLKITTSDSSRVLCFDLNGVQGMNPREGQN